MKKFLEFIEELLGPPITFLLMISFGFLCIFWVSSLFGLFVFFAPSPTWLRWLVGIVDSSLLILIIYAWISDAYNKIYNQ